jgi:hypothetical protein
MLDVMERPSALRFLTIFMICGTLLKKEPARTAYLRQRARVPA